MSHYIEYDLKSDNYIRKPIPDSKYYVVSQDSFMSNWGPAKNKINICVVPCDSKKEATKVLEYVLTRPEQKRAGIMKQKPGKKEAVVYSLVEGWKNLANKLDTESV